MLAEKESVWSGNRFSPIIYSRDEAMSRIGRKKIPIPGGVKLSREGSLITIEGPKGKLSQIIHPLISVNWDDKEITCSRSDELKPTKQLHGLVRSLLANMVQGVTTGFEKKLLVKGIGYRASVEGNKLSLSMGQTHPVIIEAPAGITISVGDNNIITVSGADKQMVGFISAQIRSWHPPDPYIRKPEPQKGIFYEGERVKLKVGKTGA
jgi:large subunit ribosomal protein L6